MKKSFFLMFIVTVVVPFVFADGHIKFGTSEGDWRVSRGRLYQNDAYATRAKAWMKVPQKNSMVYEFTIHYEGGIEDGYAGVGLHILSDAAISEKSWGMSDSWLLWLNYDVSPVDSTTPKGLSAQIYKSKAFHDMNLVSSLSLRGLEPLFVKYMNRDIPIKITYLADRGRVLVADPRGETPGWYVDLPRGRNETGSYVAVRTNSVKMSFTSPDINL